MTIQEINGIFEETGYPFSYGEFQGDRIPEKPFLIWDFPHDSDFYADGKNYQSIKNLNLSLYTRTKDFAAEKNVENVLRRHGFSWYRDEQYIDQENGYAVLYELEVLLNE